MPNYDIPMSAIASALAHEQKPVASGSLLSRLSFPFYQAPMGSTSLLRFLPDADEDNQLPWIEQHTIRLPFQGISNSDHDTAAEVVVSVPALSTWGRKDPITEDLKPLWNGGENDRLLAKTYYRKVSYLMPCFVVSTPIVEKQPADSPIRLVKLGKQLHDVVKASLTSADMEYSPFGFDHGRDFKVTKTQQGSWANYSTSAFAYRERPLDASERDAIAKFGLLDLSAFLGVEPDEETVAMIWELYQASVAHEAFDDSKYGRNFRAFESQFNTPGPANPNLAINPERTVSATEAIAGLREKARASA